MFKFSALVAVATLSFSASAFAGSTPNERLNRVLSLLGQRSAENVQVLREDTVETGVRFKRHTRQRDAEETSVQAPAQVAPQPQKPTVVHAITVAPQKADPTPEEAKQINRLPDESGLPKEETGGDDGLRNLPKGDMGAIYDTKDAAVKAKQPKFGLGSLDMGKGPRSAPSIRPAK